MLAKNASFMPLNVENNVQKLLSRTQNRRRNERVYEHRPAILFQIPFPIFASTTEFVLNNNATFVELTEKNAIILF